MDWLKQVAEFPTPSLHIDGAVVQANVRRMAAYAREHSLALRPHTKTHKSRQVAALQLAEGAVGLTVAKVGEAEVLADVCDDILIAYPMVDPHRCRRVAELARRITVRVALDSMLSVERLAQAAREARTRVGVLVDYDLGYGRTGVQTDEEAIALGRQIQHESSLDLNGIMTYTGHISGSAAVQAEAFAQVAERLTRLRAAWDAAGLPCEILSGGSTPAAYACHLAQHFTEIRPGTYVYNDMNTVRGGYCGLEDCAARIVATVVSTAVPGQIVLDCGSKTLTSDRCGPAPESGHGWIVEYPEARVARLTEEHAQVDVLNCACVPALGERVTVIPNHICVCVNMQSHFYWHQHGAIEERAVDGRGLLV